MNTQKIMRCKCYVMYIGAVFVLYNGPGTQVHFWGFLYNGVLTATSCCWYNQIYILRISSIAGLIEFTGSDDDEMYVALCETTAIYSDEWEKSFWNRSVSETNEEKETFEFYDEFYVNKATHWTLYHLHDSRIYLYCIKMFISYTIYTLFISSPSPLRSLCRQQQCLR